MDLSQYLTKEQFYLNFISDDRYKFFINGLKVTLTVTFFSVLIGIVIGFLVGTIRSTYDKTGKMRILDMICKAYLSIIRGTPVLVQLMIMYFIVFSSPDANKMVTAVLAFAINSGAYVAEIFRSGIMSVDNGQFEAGRSLGFNYVQTIWYIVLPQAFKNALPALCNEFIALLKETSVVSFIALQDLTRAGDLVKSRTYNPVLPIDHSSVDLSGCCNNPYENWSAFWKGVCARMNDKMNAIENRTEPLIHVENLSKSFKGSQHVLKNINVDIYKGDIVFVVGPSGSGKSTFLRCLNRLEEPTGGHILFEGTDITNPKTNIDKLRQKMGMVFQQFNLFPHMTIMKNLTIAPVEIAGTFPAGGRTDCDGAFEESRTGRQSGCISEPAVRWSETENCDR